VKKTIKISLVAGGGIMRKFYLFMAVLFAGALFALVWIGCSDSSTSLSSSTSTEPGLAEYFPLKPGSSVHYIEINNNIDDTTYFLCTVGSSVAIGNYQGYYWIKINQDYPGQIDTGYVFYNSNAVYFVEDPNDIPEKLLESPFMVGRSWTRYDASQVLLDNNIIDSIIGNNDSKYDDDNGALGAYNGGGETDPFNDNDWYGTAKSFPSIGANYFQLSAKEDIVLDLGTEIDDCIKIENRNGSATNYYWYAPDAGLVRYVIGVNPDTNPDGELVGEIIY